MPFDPTPILSGPHCARHGSELRITWASSAPFGTVFQLYADNRLVYAGRQRACTLPAAFAGSVLRVGVVDPAERLTDFGASLPAVPGAARRPELSWDGGTYLLPELASFRVFRGATPGAPVDYGSPPVAVIPAYPRGVLNDGFGVGGFGRGGFGLAASSYRWVGPPLAAGTWHFGVVPVGNDGSQGPAWEPSVTIATAPDPPTGLSYRYDTVTRQVTLDWS